MGQVLPSFNIGTYIVFMSGADLRKISVKYLHLAVGTRAGIGKVKLIKQLTDCV